MAHHTMDYCNSKDNVRKDFGSVSERENNCKAVENSLSLSSLFALANYAQPYRTFNYRV